MSLDIQAEGAQGCTPDPTRPAARRACAECTYAELFAVQPRVRCTHPASPFSGKVLFVGQRACDHIVIHPERALRLSVYGAPIAGYISRAEAEPAVAEPSRMHAGS